LVRQAPTRFFVPTWIPLARGRRRKENWPRKAAHPLCHLSSRDAACCQAVAMRSASGSSPSIIACLSSPARSLAMLSRISLLSPSASVGSGSVIARLLFIHAPASGSSESGGQYGVSCSFYLVPKPGRRASAGHDGFRLNPVSALVIAGPPAAMPHLMAHHALPADERQEDLAGFADLHMRAREVLSVAGDE
jgi:hypothetical protein